MDFALALNSGKYSGDNCGFFICIFDDEEDVISPTRTSVSLEEFHIHPKQCRLATPYAKNSMSKAHMQVFEAYATLSVANDKKKWEYFQQCEAKWQ